MSSSSLLVVVVVVVVDVFVGIGFDALIIETISFKSSRVVDKLPKLKGTLKTFSVVVVVVIVAVLSATTVVVTVDGNETVVIAVLLLLVVVAKLSLIRRSSGNDLQVNGIGASWSSGFYINKHNYIKLQI